MITQRMWLVCVVLAFGLWETAQACGGGLEGPGGTTLPPRSTFSTQPPINAQTVPPAAGFGPIKDCNNDLSCGFDKPCCWQNAKPPRDSLEYVTDDGTSPNFKSYYPTASSAPTGRYLTTIGEPRTPATSTAQFYSCPIPCTDGLTNVTLRYWQTSGVVLQVCKHAVGDPGPPTDCRILPATSQGGTPYTVQLPPGQNWEVVLLSTNFGQTREQEDHVGFDDISVQAACCRPVTGPDPLCCHFDQGNTCQYTSTGGKPIQAQQKPIGNMDTGIFKPAEGSGYGGTVLNPGESTMLASAPLNNPAARQVKFKYYDGTEGMVVKCCVNDPNNCPFQNQPTVTKASRQWQEATCPVDQNTRQVFFVAQNNKNNIGAAGFDSIRAVDGNGQSLCERGGGPGGPGGPEGPGGPGGPGGPSGSSGSGVFD